MYNCRDIFFPSQLGFGFFVHFGLLILGCTRKVIPPPWYKGGGGLMKPLPQFLICCSISKRFCLQWKAFDLLYKGKYILWVVARLEAYDVTTHGRHLGLILSRIRNQLKSVRINCFSCLRVNAQKNRAKSANGGHSSKANLPSFSVCNKALMSL